MKPEKKERLEEHGWRVSSADDFLGLTPEETAMVELRLSLADAVRVRRKGRRLTQEQVAQLLGSSQSRVAKVEAADGSVSLDLLVRSFLALGGTRKELAEVVGAGG